MQWNTAMFGSHTYQFFYDGANRITNAYETHYTTSYSYDKNGNISSLTRQGSLAGSEDYGAIDELTYTYQGNQLQSVNDVNNPDYQNNGYSDNGISEPIEFTYDDNGNMISDLNKHLVVANYNHLNLPQQLNLNPPQHYHEISYLYTALGQKLCKATHIDYTLATTTDYIGSFVYKDGVLQTILTPEGRVVVDGSNYEYQYFLKDHLGNTRITFNECGIIQEDSYYPFGMAMAGLSHSSGEDLPNKNLYNAEKPEIFDFIVFRASTKNYKNRRFFIFRDGKELQDDYGLGWYDYGARFYDATIGRWHVVDNKTEKYYWISQYAYAVDNPLRFLDPDGNEIVDATGKPITYDAKNGWSPNATSSVKIIHQSLILTETGSQQWEKAYTSESKIEMNIVEEKLYSQKSPGKLSLGQTDQALGFNAKTVKYVKTESVMKINISTGTINESFDGKNKGLTLRQAIGATAGHEIEHTTEENRDIGIQNLDYPTLSKDDKGRDRIEIKPREMGRKIREESRNSLKRLAPIIPKVLDNRSFDPSQGGFY